MLLYKQALKTSLSSLLKLGNETFDNFDLTWYDDTYDTELGMSPRSHMEGVCEMCYRYANKFGDKSTNLFLNGSPGLGKTFLSACIARVVADKGFSVVYDMAGSVFAAFEEEKFSKSADMASLREDIRRYLECDLLILDDLGTEMTTAFTISALYELLNTRLLACRKTIINSNLTIDELPQDTRIGSRLASWGNIVLKYYGSDLRL
jgi:DNA replication protein DnaC